jgi:hypothetical protein
MTVWAASLLSETKTHLLLAIRVGILTPGVLEGVDRFDIMHSQINVAKWKHGLFIAERAQLSDGGHTARRLQSRRDVAVGCSAHGSCG